MPRRGPQPPKEVLQPRGAGPAGLFEDDRLAADLRGFGPIGIIAIFVIAGNMVVLPIGAFLVLAWTWRSHTAWRAIGYARPRVGSQRWPAASYLAPPLKIPMKMLVMPLLGADPVNHAYHFLVGNRAILPAAVWAMLVAGFAEETVFRGYLFERSAKLFGCGAAAKASTVLVTSGLFGLAHYADQGLARMGQGAITGLVLGAIFAVTGRIFLIWNLESRVAHFVFK